MKIREVLKNGIDELNINNIAEAVLKSKILLEYELNVNDTYLAVHSEDEIDSQTTDKFRFNLEKIIDGKPIQYITNSQEFYGLNFYVDENVLIPQPDTEILVEEIIMILKKLNKSVEILDMCTGSGAIAISIAKNIECNMDAIDISSKALEIAKRNSIDNNLKINFFESNMFEKINKKYDVIVSNPPYIETKCIEHLSKEVKNEPKIALDGGESGLDFYKILCENANDYLKPEGILAVEIGYDQKENVVKLFKENGFKDIYSKKDYGNNDRIVVGKLKGKE